MSPRSNRKTSVHLISSQLQKTLDLDELLAWARDMVMWYWSADTLLWQVSVDHNMDVQYQRSTQYHHYHRFPPKPRLHVSLSTCYLESDRHVARLLRRHRRRRHRVYAPKSNTASHDNHEKINSWVSFCFPYMGYLWGSTWRPFGPPELRC